MGFPYDVADWAAAFAEEASGVLFMGFGGAAGVYTVISMIACVVVLWLGNASEHKRYKQMEK